jgi:hypothetical protein
MGDYDWYLDHTPAGKPPPGVEPNFDNPESHSYQLVIVVAVMIALMTIFTGSRVYVRLRITKSFGAEDYICILAYVFTLALDIESLMMLDHPGGGPAGTHIWDVTLRKWIYYSKLALANSPLARSSNISIKCAFLVFYLRLFGPKDHIRPMVWAGIGVLLSFYVAWIIAYLVCAVPGDGGYLDPAYQAQMADKPNKLVLAACYMSVISDVYILLIPMHQVPKLALSYKRKWGISLIFATGLMATTAGVINIICRHSKTLWDTSDMTWYGIYILMTGLIEVNLGMVCLSMPVVLALFVGRVTAFGQSLGSWVNVRKAQRQGAGDSASDLAPDGNESGPDSSPEYISNQIPEPRVRGMPTTTN